jgi:hypothetical protein
MRQVLASLFLMTRTMGELLPDISTSQRPSSPLMVILCASVCAQTVSPERQAYLNALNQYNAYVTHHVTIKQMKGKYGLDLSAGNPRTTVACHLSAQVVVGLISGSML